MDKRLRICRICILVILAVGVTAFFSIESYWSIQPYIDTRFSLNFNEKAFDEIEDGVSVQEVASKLGIPIWKIGCGGCWEENYYSNNGLVRLPRDAMCDAPCSAESQRWQFSEDGACGWWDFAWKEFSLDMHNGKVTKKLAVWHYD